MKNLVMLAHTGFGDRNQPNAPTDWKTIEGFIAHGWNVWVIHVGTKSDTVLGVRTYDDGLYIQGFNPPFLRASGIRKIGWFFSLFNTVWTCRKLQKEAERLILQQRLLKGETVIYAMDTDAVKAGKILSEKLRFPLVTRFYGIWDMLDIPDILRNRIKYYPKFQAYGTNADIVLMTNDGTRGDELLKRSGNMSEKILFWRNGVDVVPADETDDISLPLEPTDHVLMTLCRLHPGKRVNLAIDALAKVIQTLPNTKLVICGYGSEYNNLLHQAAELGLSEKVIFTGEIPHSKVHYYLRRADLFLSLYSASNLGNPLFEAMRCARAIITLDVGATDTVIHDNENGILLPADGLDRLPQEICRLLSDDDERKRLGEGALRFAEENFWTWDERIAAEVQEVSTLLQQGE